MNKELCIVHANCQGEPLIERLKTCPEFSERYDVTLFTNYTREPIPAETLGRCSLFLYQYLDDKWNELASNALLKNLPESTTHLCIPNMFFKGYWPLWSGAQGFDYRCRHLDDFIAKKLPPEETILLFLHSDITTIYDLIDLVGQTIEQERGREARTPIKYLNLLIENYRDQRLFNTINHPGSFLMNHVARGILTHLGFESLNENAMESLGEPFPEFEQPINPKIGHFFGWNFAGADTQYEIYGRKMTFARYAANYVMARQANISDFIGFLQGNYIGI